MINIRIGVCGGSKPTTETELASAFHYGRAVEEAFGSVVGIVYGACPGGPDEFVKGFLAGGGAHKNITAISPWSSEARHRGDNFLKMSFPIHGGVGVTYTGLGAGRNAMIIEQAQVVIFFGGGLGTLGEMTLAGAYKRYMFIVKSAGGASALLPEILETLDKKGLDRLRVVDTPENLIAELKALNLGQVPRLEW